MSVVEDSDKSNYALEENIPHSQQKAKEHIRQLQRLQDKDPEFYQFLKKHDKELLEFNDEGSDEDTETDLDEVEPQVTTEKVQKPSGKVITTAMVDSWCTTIKEHEKLGAVRSLLRAFRTACHYGDDGENESAPRFSIISSSVFNKVMVFVLNEMDGILRGLLKAPSSGGKKETIMDLTTTKEWEKYGSLMRLYLGNALHILTQMTDEQMISFTLRRVKASAVFLAAFPTLQRKYIKAALHSWGSGRGALPVVSFLFLRDLCIRLGSDCLDTCLKGIYKAYVMNCKLAKSVSASKLQHIHFLGNCVTELYGVDLPSAYQHAFVFIRQLAMILRGALTERTKEAYQKVYDWQFICCLELWTGVVCAYNSEADFRPLAYPLTQIISGVARLVPTAQYFPLRVRCVRMLNRIAGATDTFIPVSALLLDMLEMKELNRVPTGGVGKAINLLTMKQVGKPALKTRAFQEACVFSVVEQLSEHLAQWSYSIAFFELSFIPSVRLRSFCKSTNNDRFRREIRELIRQIEANSEFTNSRRMAVNFSPNDPSAASFLKVEKESGSSLLSQFVANIRRRAQQRNDSLVESSILVGAESSVFSSKLSEIKEEDDGGNVEVGSAIFSSSWMPKRNSKSTAVKPKHSKKHHDQEYHADANEDLVEDLVLSSDDDEAPGSESVSEEEENSSKHTSLKQETKKRKLSTRFSKKRGQARSRKKAKKGASH